MLTRSYGSLLFSSPRIPDVQYRQTTVYSLVKELSVEIPDFQRELRQTHVDTIQSVFQNNPSIIIENVIKFGTVSRIDNNRPKLYILDGQHRFQALRNIVESEQNQNGTVSSLQVMYVLRYCKNRIDMENYYKRINRNTPLDDFVTRLFDDIEDINPDDVTDNDVTTESAGIIYQKFYEFIKGSYGLQQTHFLSDTINCNSPHIHLNTFMKKWIQSTEHLCIRSFQDMKNLFLKVNSDVESYYKGKIHEIEINRRCGRNVPGIILNYEIEYNNIMNKHKKCIDTYRIKHQKLVSHDIFPPFFLGTSSNILIIMRQSQNPLTDKLQIRVPKWDEKSRNKEEIKRIVLLNYANGNEVMPCACCAKEISRYASDKYEQCDFGHIIAKRHGGSFSVDNLRPVCSRCNGRMRSINMDDYIEQIRNEDGSVSMLNIHDGNNGDDEQVEQEHYL
jgi:5-methylcytosine-specific restriction endonuclease McrA